MAIIMKTVNGFVWFKCARAPFIVWTVVILHAFDIIILYRQQFGNIGLILDVLVPDGDAVSQPFTRKVIELGG